MAGWFMITLRGLKNLNSFTARTILIFPGSWGLKTTGAEYFNFRLLCRNKTYVSDTTTYWLMNSASLTIPSLFNATLSAFPDATFLQYRQGEQIISLTYREIGIAVDRLAISLAQFGYKKGDRIALLAENSCEWVITYLAIVHAGCVVVPLDSIMPLPDILHILDLSRSRLLFCSERFERLINGLPQPPKIPVERLGQFHSHRGSADSQEIRPELQNTDTAVVIYTSGTTGHSKGVVLSHENLASNVLACGDVCEITKNDTFLLLLPLHHAFSSTVNMMLTMAVGARATLATSYRSRDIVDDIRIGGVTVLVGVPQIFENIKNAMQSAVRTSGKVRRALFHTLKMISQVSGHAGLNLGDSLFGSLRRKSGLHCIRLMVSGGAALPTAVNRFFEAIGFILIQGYGLTECSPVLCVNPPTKNKIGSVGPPLPGVNLRINNSNSEGIGEVWACGPNTMQGYDQNEAATREVLRGGWLNTSGSGH